MTRGLLGKHGARPSMLWFHNHGFGNTGATSGHLVPDYKTVLEIGWHGIYANLQKRYQALPSVDQRGPKGAQLPGCRSDLVGRDSGVTHSDVHPDADHGVHAEQHDAAGDVRWPSAS